MKIVKKKGKDIRSQFIYFFFLPSFSAFSVGSTTPMGQPKRRSRYGAVASVLLVTLAEPERSEPPLQRNVSVIDKYFFN